MAYGVTIAGFVSKDLQTIISEIQTDFQTAFGQDIDVSIESVSGQLIRAIAKREADLWDLAQAVYSGFNPDSASGNALDGVCANVGIYRLPAVPTTVPVILYGTVGTVILAGHLVSQSQTQKQFVITESVTIDGSNVGDAQVSVEAHNATTYTITVNGVDYTYLSDGTATVNEIVAGLLSALSTATEVATTNNGDGTFRIYASDGTTFFTLAVGTYLTISSQGAIGDYEAVIAEALSVPSATIVTIVTPISGLSSISNITTGTVGRTLETDEDLRVRRRTSLQGRGKATEEALRAGVLQNVPNVDSCFVVSNRTDATDGDGRSPHSFEVVVVGGDEQEIADIIWQYMPAGIQPVGDITKTVTDSTGASQTVKFSRPTSIYVWVDIEQNLYSEEAFPINGATLEKDAIIAWALENLTVGTDVIRQRLNIPIYEIPGIGNVTILLGTSVDPLTPPVSYGAVDITIGSTEIANLDQSRIAVAIV